MSAKLKLTPSVSYILGVYHASAIQTQPIKLHASNSEMLERFIKIAISELGVEPSKILLDGKNAAFYNSKIKKLFDKALERRLVTFKYRNAYSGSYISGLFDASGGRDRKGLYIKNLDNKDALLLENLGIHTMVQGSKSYIIDESLFLSLVKGYSSIMKK